MKNKFSVCLMLILAFGFAQKNLIKKSDAVRLSPRLLNYQGYLTDTLGNPITNPSVSMNFTIYDTDSGGNQQWSETQDFVSVDKGIFHALLGSVTPIPDSVFTVSTNRWLELSVSGQILAPRTRIISAGYAYTATYSDTALYAKSANPDTDWVITDSTMYSGITGKVGIGTSNPSEQLEVSGNIKVSGTGNGLTFPDATKQTTAASGGVPQGYCILGTTTVSPIGYTYNGQYIISNDTGPETWRTRANMPTGRQLLTAVAVNGKIYAIGGFNNNPLQNNEEYDPVTNTWQIKANMPTARGALAGAAVNGKIYVIGGYTGTDYLQTNEEYDPVSNTWQTKANMPTSRWALAAATVNGKIYVIGGRSTTNLQTNEEYDPVSNTWTTKANMPTARNGIGLATVNGKIYAFGGLAGIYLQTNEEYDPIANAWQTKALMPTERYYLAAEVVNGKIYNVGGYNFYGPLQTNEEYDPVSNTWQTRADLPTGRQSLTAVAVNGKIYAIGGYRATVMQTNEEYQSPPVVFYLYMKN